MTKRPPCVGCLVTGIVVVGGLMIVVTIAYRRALYPPPPSSIRVPEYPEPEANAFEELDAAARPLWADKKVVIEACEAPWHQPNTLATELLHTYRVHLARARQALASECLHPRTVRDAEGLWSAFSLRLLACLFALEGRRYEREGLHDRALDSYTQALRLAPVAARNGGIMEMLSAVRITRLAAPDLARRVGSRKPTEEGLAALRDALDEIIDKQVPYHEALAIQWAIDSTTMDDLAAGRMTVAELRDGPVFRDTGQGFVDRPRHWRLVMRGRPEVDRKYAKAIEDAQKPYWKRTYRMPRPATLLARMTLWLPNPSSASEAAAAAALVQGLRIQVAIELHRKQRGAIPTSLSELTPDYLADLPVDPFTGKPFRYRRADDSCRLYSVGPDAKDDGGAPLDRKTNEGDIVIWPVEG